MKQDQSVSLVSQSCLTLCNPMDCSTPGFPVLRQLKFMSIESVMPSNHIVLYCPLPLLPSIFPSIRVFSNELVLHIRWPKYGVSASASVLPVNIQEWFPLRWNPLDCSPSDSQESSPTLSSKAPSLQCSAFFTVQLSHPCMTTGKPIALTRWTFVSIVMSMVFNMLSRLVIAFLPRRKCLFISWLQSPSAVILETKKIKSLTVSIFVSPSICYEVMGLDAMVLVFWMLSFKTTF